MTERRTAIALLGLGEVGRVLAEDLPRQSDVRLTVWDTAFADPASRASRNAQALSLAPSESATVAVADADVVISAVTAANTLVAAQAAVEALRPGVWYLDLNSASPGQKIAAAAEVEKRDGHYVEVAVMAPIEPARLRTRLLLGGRHASASRAVAAALGLTEAVVYSDVLGRAAATKLCRSVVIKGVEALLTESLLAARSWGVEQDVLASLSNLLPADDWDGLAAYMISRSLVHGTRRSEEMFEAAATVEDTGLEPIMTTATARVQAWTAGRAEPAASEDLGGLLDSVRGSA